MRNEFPGWYRVSDEELDLLWREGVITLDASSLLAPYRLGPDARRRLFDIIDAHQAQVWLPYQAGLEYQRNRLGIIADMVTVYQEIHAKLKRAEQELLQGGVNHPVLRGLAYKDNVKRALAGIRRVVDQAKEGHFEVLSSEKDQDPIRDRWDQLLSGRIGKVLSIDSEWKKWADQRYEAKIPPGFADLKKQKVAREYGDLIIWCEILEYIKQRRSAAQDDVPVPVMFITDDMKDDWWRKEAGQRLGPRPELVEELRAAGGQPFWMYSVPRFIDTGSNRLGWDKSVHVETELQETGPEGAAESGEGAAPAEVVQTSNWVGERSPDQGLA